MRTQLLIFVGWLAACGQNADLPIADNAAAFEAVSMEGLQAHLSYLASDDLEGRLPGAPGYDAAAQYVADQFAALGMEPAGDDGWFQQVPLISYRLDEAGARVIAHRDGADTELQFADDYVMFGDTVRAENLVRGEVVYVGFGVHAPDLGYSDYDGVDVSGKIVAVFSNAPDAFPHNERAYYAATRTKVEEAVSRGAIGYISLLTKYVESNYPWERIKTQLGSTPGMAWLNFSGEAADYHPELRGTVLLSVDAARRLFAGTPISFDDARAAAEASKPASVALGFEVTMGRKTRHDTASSANVVGIIRGTDPEVAGEYVVYSAHLDHNGVGVPVDGDAIYNGAYDNAMGSALLIETAKVFAAAPPRRSVLLLAVTGEERGLLGSDYFAHYPTVPTEAMVANINLDMPLFLFPVADIIAFGAEHSSLEATVAEAIRDEGFILTPDPFPQETVFVRSDQYSFVRKGVPAVFLVPGYTSTDPNIDGQAAVVDFRKHHYHQPSDDLSQPVDWDSAVRFARANARIGYAIGNADARPTWNEGDFFGEKFAR